MPHQAKYNRPEDIERQRIKDYQTVFNSDKGREVLMDMVRATSTMEICPPTDLEPLVLAYRAGAQSVVLAILKVINKDAFKLAQEMTDYERRHYTDGWSDNSRG